MRVRVFPGVVISPIVTDRSHFYGVAAEASTCPITISLEFRRNCSTRKDETVRENSRDNEKTLILFKVVSGFLRRLYV